MQPKKPRFNPLILALALAAVLMVWSVLGGGSSSGGSSSMVYSTAVQYFENLQVTKFTLDLNTGVLTMTLKEGKLDLPDPSSVSTVQSTGGLLSGMLSSSSSGSTGAEKNSDGTVTGKTTDGRDVILTPYYKWNNRGNCGMRIWLKQDGMKRDGSLTGWEKRLYRPWKID